LCALQTRKEGNISTWTHKSVSSPPAVAETPSIRREAQTLDTGEGGVTAVYSFLSRYSLVVGRAIAQAVSRRLPTAAARVQTGVWSCGIL
jgi:hypothetical protein